MSSLSQDEYAESFLFLLVLEYGQAGPTSIVSPTQQVDRCCVLKKVCLFTIILCSMYVSWKKKSLKVSFNAASRVLYKRTIIKKWESIQLRQVKKIVL